MWRALKVAEVKGVVVAPDRSAVVVKTVAVMGAQRTDLEIAITTDLAVNVALALLATTAQARAERDDLAPALEALAAAIVPSGRPDTVRLQLLFDKGVVLPVELSTDAAAALHAGLGGELEPADTDPAR